MATARIGDHRAEALNFKLSAAQVVNVSEDEEKKWIERKYSFYDNQLSKYTDADTLVLCRLGGYFPMIPPTTCRKLSDNMRQVVIEL